jgi:hypothetical protein
MNLTAELQKWAKDEAGAAEVFHSLAVRRELAGDMERAKELRRHAAEAMCRAIKWEARARLAAGGTAEVGR